MKKYVYNRKNENPIFCNIEIYNKYHVIYHMFIREKYITHKIMYMSHIKFLTK